MSRSRDEYSAHPAFLLKEKDAGAFSLDPDGLGYRWLKRDRADRERQQGAFFAALVEGLARTPGATFVARFSDLRSAEGFASTFGAARDGYQVTGTCTDGSARALLGEQLDELVIFDGGMCRRLSIDGRPDDVKVWLTDDEAQTWRRRLEDAVRSSDEESQTADRERRERPILAVLYLLLSNALWIVPSLISIAAMMALNRLGVSLVIAVPVGFVLLAALILGPPITVSRRALRRML